jgi:tubulin polyglutamylase TTLL4
MMREMERLVMATVIAATCEWRQMHGAAVPHRHTSHEVYGIDILLNKDLHAHLIETNIHRHSADFVRHSTTI